LKIKNYSTKENRQKKTNPFLVVASPSSKLPLAKKEKEGGGKYHPTR
jgi:hypothetical protein